MTKNVFVNDVQSATSRRTKLIAFVHHKGGTGKTTSCINVAGWLVKMKKKVLIVDLDPQGNATAGLSVDRNSMDSSIYDVLLDYKRMDEVILETDSGIYLAPSSLDLLAAENQMSGLMNNTSILKEKLDYIEDSFDYILIDVPPGSTLLMVNGIVAARNIIIPLDSGIFAYEAMVTLKTLILELHRKLGVETNIMMVLLRKYGTSVFDQGPNRAISKLLKEFLTVNNIPTVRRFSLPFSQQVYKSQMRGKPISHYAPYSDVGRMYKRIAKEITQMD